ncbi:MAG: DUF4236 domain-containing protein [Actinomycetes bacterium]
MGISFRKSKSFGPLRLNFSKKGVGLSVGVKGLRVGTKAGSKGVYLRGGKGPIRFNERLDTKVKGSSKPAIHDEVRSPAQPMEPQTERAEAPISLVLPDAGTTPPKSRVRLDTLLSFEGTAKPNPE